MWSFVIYIIRLETWDGRGTFLAIDTKPDGTRLANLTVLLFLVKRKWFYFRLYLFRLQYTRLWILHRNKSCVAVDFTNLCRKNAQIQNNALLSAQCCQQTHNTQMQWQATPFVQTQSYLFSRNMETMTVRISKIIKVRIIIKSRGI